MKKIILVIGLLCFSMTQAKVCSKRCYSGSYGIGYAWNQPDGTTCGGVPLSSNTTVYYAYALADADGNGFIVDSGTTCASCMGC